jgi:hypothetical protein
MTKQTRPIPYSEKDIESGLFHLIVYPKIKQDLELHNLDLSLTYDEVTFQKVHKAAAEIYTVKDEVNHKQKFIYFNGWFTFLLLLDFANNRIEHNIMMFTYDKQFVNQTACRFTAVYPEEYDLIKVQQKDLLKQ